MKFSTVLLASAAILSGASASVVWEDYDPGRWCQKACYHHKPDCSHGWVRRGNTLYLLWKRRNIANTSHAQYPYKWGVSITLLTSDCIPWKLLTLVISIAGLAASGMVIIFKMTKMTSLDGLTSDDYLVLLSSTWREYILISAGH
jgi:hypothetical protein